MKKSLGIALVVGLMVAIITFMFFKEATYDVVKDMTFVRPEAIIKHE